MSAVTVSAMELAAFFRRFARTCKCSPCELRQENGALTCALFSRPLIVRSTGARVTT